MTTPPAAHYSAEATRHEHLDATASAASRVAATAGNVTPRQIDVTADVREVRLIGELDLAARTV